MPVELPGFTLRNAAGQYWGGGIKGTGSWWVSTKPELAWQTLDEVRGVAKRLAAATGEEWTVEEVACVPTG